MSNQLHSMKESILAKIEKGEVSMRPRWHFVLKGLLFGIGIAISTVGLLYLLSFIVFILGQSGVLFVPAFGFRGVLAFLLASPWLLILLATAFILVLEVLVRHFSFSYRKPLFYTVLAIVLFSLVGTFVIAQTPMHEKFQRSAESGTLPFMGRMYNFYGEGAYREIHKGVITAITDTGFIVQNRRETLEIHTGPATQFPLGADFSVGDRIVVLGERNGSIVEAKGVRAMPEGKGGLMQGRNGGGIGMPRS